MTGMRYRLLGRSGLRVSELALGTMTFGRQVEWGADKAGSRRMFRAYADAGGNLIDTANRYTMGTSERMVGEFVRGDRDRFVIATKYSLVLRDGDPNAGGNHRKNLRASLRGSLERLGTDHVDLLWVHAYDGLTPVEEVVRALDDVVREGLVHYVGVSDTPAWVVARAVTMAERMGWTPYTALQLRYSLVDRTAERELLPMARALDLAVTPWAVLGAGVLTGKYARGRRRKEKGRFDHDPARSQGVVTDRNLAIAAEVAAVAGDISATPSQVALAWARQQPGNVIPILGVRTLAQAREDLGCLDVTLGPDHMRRLDGASRIEPGFPHDFLASDFVRYLISGGTRDSIDALPDRS
jgi:aryl-alcohol dehydrogenase-like predicted oxidoreductase